jgi:hypothetical protein
MSNLITQEEFKAHKAEPMFLSNVPLEVFDEDCKVHPKPLKRSGNHRHTSMDEAQDICLLKLLEATDVVEIGGKFYKLSEV